MGTVRTTRKRSIGATRYSEREMREEQAQSRTWHWTWTAVAAALADASGELLTLKLRSVAAAADWFSPDALCNCAHFQPLYLPVYLQMYGARWWEITLGAACLPSNFLIHRVSRIWGIFTWRVQRSLLFAEQILINLHCASLLLTHRVFINLLLTDA